MGRLQQAVLQPQAARRARTHRVYVSLDALPPGRIVIWRNTETNGGITQFTSLSNFSAGGALLAPVAAPAKRIEVIGDSLSVGAGVEGNATCTGGIDAYTNNYLAYGSVAARGHWPRPREFCVPGALHPTRHPPIGSYPRSLVARACRPKNN